jgi:Enoyl-(Acyl carrier protein) reductase
MWQDDPKRSAEILARLPAGRWGEPDDMAGPAVFVCSSASDYLHGVVLPVDGGSLAGQADSTRRSAASDNAFAVAVTAASGATWSKPWGTSGRRWSSTETPAASSRAA